MVYETFQDTLFLLHLKKNKVITNPNLSKFYSRQRDWKKLYPTNSCEPTRFERVVIQNDQVKRVNNVWFPTVQDRTYTHPWYSSKMRTYTHPWYSSEMHTYTHPWYMSEMRTHTHPWYTSKMRTHTHPWYTSKMHTHTHPWYTSEMRTYTHIYIWMKIAWLKKKDTDVGQSKKKAGTSTDRRYSSMCVMSTLLRVLFAW